MLGQGLRPWQPSWRLIAHRQNHAFCLYGTGIREVNDGPFALRFNVQNFGSEEFRRDGSHAACALQMVMHDGAQIVAIYHSWNESFAQFDFGRGVKLRTSAQPSKEMVGLVGKGGHISRGDVQQVFRASRAVSKASPRRAATVDHCHAERTLAESHQIHCGHDAAETTSDNSDAFGG